MFCSHSTKARRGFSLVEMVVTAALVALVFGGIIASVQFALKLVSSSKLTTSATSLANERMEYLRSLTYSAVGTDGGIPSGVIPQNSTTTLNGVTFYERVLIQYIDSPDDGLGVSDINGIVSDYKQAKVEYSWATPNGTSTIFLLSNIVPPGIESDDGGGTLTVNVFDATALPVSGAEVHIYNDTTTTTINTSRFTNVDGVVMFSGAPAAANYQITVTKLGYSTDQTYTATTSNPNPVTSHVAVLEGNVSTMNFQIAELSDLLVRTVGPSTDGDFEDLFANADNIALSTDTAMTSNEVVLAGGAGAYVSLGSVQSTSTTPSVITAWDTVSWNALTPTSTAVKVQLCSITGTSTCVLIPDSDLVGNSAGFTSSPINISGLNTGTYPTLALLGTLTSSDVNNTPELDDWKINYIITEPNIGGVPFTIQGTKTIGTTLALAPIYKYTANSTTDGSGETQFTDLEWDAYTITLGTSAYDVSSACPSNPYVLNPNESDTLTLTLVPSSTYSLRASVTDGAGDPIAGATVHVTRAGVNETETTSTCGQSFFNSGLVSDTDYTVDVSAPGFVTQNLTNVAITGTSELSITLVEI
jgi:prepilin-type N-terminal cleavage/methylation domain-containing protein